METTTETSGRRARRRRRVTAALAAAAAATLLAAAGCGDDDDTTAAGGSGGGGGGGDELTVDITTPADGAAVGETFDVDVETSVPIGDPDTGRHHVHLYYDGNTSEGEYDVVYEPTFTVEGLDAGEHTIEAVVANADHSLTDARAEIEVSVGDAAGGSGTTADDSTETSDDSDYGY